MSREWRATRPRRCARQPSAMKVAARAFNEALIAGSFVSANATSQGGATRGGRGSGRRVGGDSRRGIERPPCQQDVAGRMADEELRGRAGLAAQDAVETGAARD